MLQHFFQVKITSPVTLSLLPKNKEIANNDACFFSIWNCLKRPFNLYYKGWCVFVCGHLNVRTLTSPPILKLWFTQGYLWLSYDLTEVINLIGVTFEQNKYFFSERYFMSFLPHYCHSFRITVIPSGLLSFLPDYCHSFRISVIPSKYCHSFQIIQRITNAN